jgi:hypothetical protein
MHWLLEAAVAVNNNSENLLRYLHELRRCTQKPNKLVACAFEALSDGPVLSAIAARAIYFVEVISIAIFAHPSSNSRQTLHATSERLHYRYFERSLVHWQYSKISSCKSPEGDQTGLDGSHRCIHQSRGFKI